MIRRLLTRRGHRRHAGPGPARAGGAGRRPAGKGALGPDGVVIPENIIVKAPSAELRENQKDQDSLPPYDVLDATKIIPEEDLPVRRVGRRHSSGGRERDQAAPPHGQILLSTDSTHHLRRRRPGDGRFECAAAGVDNGVDTGAGEGTRTPNPSLTRRVLCRLSYAGGGGRLRSRPGGNRRRSGPVAGRQTKIKPPDERRGGSGRGRDAWDC